MFGRWGWLSRNFLCCNLVADTWSIALSFCWAWPPGLQRFVFSPYPANFSPLFLRKFCCFNFLVLHDFMMNIRFAGLTSTTKPTETKRHRAIEERRNAWTQFPVSSPLCLCEERQRERRSRESRLCNTTLVSLWKPGLPTDLLVFTAGWVSTPFATRSPQHRDSLNWQVVYGWLLSPGPHSAVCLLVCVAVCF